MNDALWIPPSAVPSTSQKERELYERLLQAEARAVRFEEALRWAAFHLPAHEANARDSISGLLA